MSNQRNGRRRKAGERYPSGKLKPTGVPPAQIKRVVAMAARGAADVLLATQLGWLRLDGAITDAQAAAGVSFATLVGQHDAALGLPHRAARSPTYQLGFAGIRAGSSPEADTERVAGLRRRHDAAVARLQECGPRVEQVVRAVCMTIACPIGAIVCGSLPASMRWFVTLDAQQSAFGSEILSNRRADGSDPWLGLFGIVPIGFSGIP